jgi:hypothetical protein
MDQFTINKSVLQKLQNPPINIIQLASHFLLEDGETRASEMSGSKHHLTLT